MPVGQSAVQIRNQQIDNARDLGQQQGFEQHDIIDSVEKLGPEMPAQVRHHRIAGRGANLAGLGHALEQMRRSDVRRHNHHGILKIHHMALGIGQPTIVEQLEQHMEHIGMGFFHLVEQNRGIRLAAHGFGQLPALVIADIPRRRADQPRHRVLFHVLAHVDANHAVFAVEKRVGQGARQLGLANAGRPQKNERPDGTARILDPCACADHRIGHQSHGLVLPDDALVQNIVQAQQLFALALHQARDRNTGPPRHGLGDFLLCHRFAQQAVVGKRRGLGNLELLFQRGQDAVLQRGGEVEIVLPFCRFDLALGPFDLLAQAPHLIEGLLFPLPLHAHVLGPHLQLGQFFLQFSQPLSARLIGF